MEENQFGDRIAVYGKQRCLTIGHEKWAGDCKIGSAVNDFLASCLLVSQSVRKSGSQSSGTGIGLLVSSLVT